MANTKFLLEYLPILIFFGIATAIASILVALPFFLSKRNSYLAKVTEYECGFGADKGENRHRFGVKFYMTAILFIIFDIEIAFMVPWTIVLHKLGIWGYASMMIFLVPLIVGFIYEWRKGAMNW